MESALSGSDVWDLGSLLEGAYALGAANGLCVDVPVLTFEQLASRAHFPLPGSSSGSSSGGGGVQVFHVDAILAGVRGMVLSAAGGGNPQVTHPLPQRPSSSPQPQGVTAGQHAAGTSMALLLQQQPQAAPPVPPVLTPAAPEWHTNAPAQAQPQHAQHQAHMGRTAQGLGGGSSSGSAAAAHKLDAITHLATSAVFGGGRGKPIIGSGTGPGALQQRGAAPPPPPPGPTRLLAGTKRPFEAAPGGGDDGDGVLGNPRGNNHRGRDGSSSSSGDTGPRLQESLGGFKTAKEDLDDRARRGILKSTAGGGGGGMFNNGSAQGYGNDDDEEEEGNDNSNDDCAGGGGSRHQQGGGHGGRGGYTARRPGQGITKSSHGNGGSGGGLHGHSAGARGGGGVGASRGGGGGSSSTVGGRGGGRVGVSSSSSSSNSSSSSSSSAAAAPEDKQAFLAQFPPDRIPPELQVAEYELIQNVMADATAPEKISISFDDIAGLEDIKAIVFQGYIAPRDERFAVTGSKLLQLSGQGLLMFGPPGTGKTLIAKAIAKECGATFFNISSSTIFSKWIGNAEKTVKIMFALARLKQPSIVFIDEIDSLLRARGGDSEAESSRRVKNEVLVQMNDAMIETDENPFVVVVGATNRPQEIDDAALRRFPKRVFVPLPSADARRQIITHALSKERPPPALSPAEVQQLVAATDGFNGSDVAQLCTGAARERVQILTRQRLTKLKLAMEGGGVSSSATALVQEADMPMTVDHFLSVLRATKSSVKPETLAEYETWGKEYGMTATVSDLEVYRMWRALRVA